MISLEQLQRAFLAELDGTVHPALRDLICSPHLPPEACIDVYRTEQQTRLSQTLARLYPISRQLMGEALFLQLAKAFGRRFMVDSSDITRYCSRFPQLMVLLSAEHPELGQLRMLPELGLLEWHLYTSAQAPADPPLGPHQLAAISRTERTRLVFDVARHLRMMYSLWPVLECWRCHKAGEALAPPPQRRQQWLCIYRERDAQAVAPLDEGLAQLLGGMLKGLNLGEIAAQSIDVDQLLPELLARQWLCDFHLQDAA